MYWTVFQRAVDAVYATNKLVDVLGQSLVLGDVGACAEIKVLRRLHAIDATRVHQTRSWVVSFLILGPFGPRRVTAMLRAGQRNRTAAGNFCR